MSRLQEIITHKKKEILPLLAREEKLRLAAMERNDFRSLQEALKSQSRTIIAEVKRASPSAGTIAEDIDPVLMAKAYADGGAQAVSVLTDGRFFQGKLNDLTRVRSSIELPVLRKDFIVHAAQIYEAVVAGADAVLLIVAALEQEELCRLLDVAYTFQLDVLVEVHDQEELDRALETEAQIIGINNRNLKTFEVDLETTHNLSEEVPEDIVLVSESGIRSAEDAQRVFEWGANGILVGESLMRSDDPGVLIEEFLQEPLSDSV